MPHIECSVRTGAKLRGKSFRASRRIIALMLCLGLSAQAAASRKGFTVTYSGGSIGSAKNGQDLLLQLDNRLICLFDKDEQVVRIASASITEVSYGQEVHRRIGTAAGVAILTFGVGAIIAFSKSKKHFIGIVWDDTGKKGGVVLRARKNDYRGLLVGLEAVTGKKAVNADADQGSSRKSPAMER